MLARPLALAFALLVPALALAEERQRIRLQAASVQPSGTLQDGDLAVETESSLGARVAWELLWSERYGLELGGSTSEHSSRARFAGEALAVGDVGITPITATFNLHPWPERRADLYFGVGAAYVMFSDVEFVLPGSPPERLSIDADLTWIAQIGLDLPVGEAFGFSVAVQYVAARADLGGLPGSPTLPVEPWILAGGLIIRF